MGWRPPPPPPPPLGQKSTRIFTGHCTLQLMYLVWLFGLSFLLLAHKKYENITLFAFSPPSFCRAYTDLGLKHETLTLIQPTFETPLPPLQPALFPPSLHEPPPPSLDLFDLDEEFSSERTRVAQITNKCMRVVCVWTCGTNHQQMYESSVRVDVWHKSPTNV